MGSGSDEEADLMRRYCDGDPQAFEALYARLAPRVLGYLAGLAGERALAQDLLQQTFLKLHVARSRYVLGAQPAPWIFTIARRVFLDDVRARARAPVRLAGDSALPEPRAGIGGGADEGGGHGEAAPRITLSDLDSLPPNQREALVLTKIEGYSVAEAAAIAGSTPGAIKLRAHRAYVALRRRLADRRVPGGERA